jgi:hypothetical protein
MSLAEDGVRREQDQAGIRTPSTWPTSSTAATAGTHPRDGLWFMREVVRNFGALVRGLGGEWGRSRKVYCPASCGRVLGYPVGIEERCECGWGWKEAKR